MQKILLVILSCLLLSACSLIYKQDIQQGNVITPDMVSQLKVGMTQEQARYVMGTPVLQSSFNPNRWDYIYTYQPGHGERTTQKVTLFFSNGILKKIVTK